jgi:hypothetical protein
VDDDDAAFDKVLHQHGYAMLDDKTSLSERVRASRNCDVMFMKEEILKSGYGIVVRKGVPYRRQFNVL